MALCPNVDQLAELMTDDLPDAQRNFLEDHLGTCELCQTNLSALAGRSVVREQWRQLNPFEGDAVSDTASLVDMLSIETSADTGKTPVLPGYEIQGVLGRGGMGVVYKARHKSLGRITAVKMLLDSALMQTEHLTRFRAEAETVARLNHPNIVQLYETGEYDARPFFALEYVEGGNLSARLREAAMPAKEAASLVESAARAVHAAHDCGVVHRDLKPSNILLTALGAPKIADFGLAKRVEGPAGPTLTGQVMGTPSYMAPEQTGDKGTISPTTDVYGLGTVLYECLTGRPPFRGVDALNTIFQVLHQEPVSPARLQPGIPRDLDTICLKCLEKDPSKRYPSALALADDLRRYLDGQSILARHANPAERALKWARRRPALAALLGVSLLTLLCLGGLITGLFYNAGLVRLNGQLAEEKHLAEQRRQESDFQKSQALKAREEADESRARAEKLNRRLDELLYISQVLRVEGEMHGGDPDKANLLLSLCRPELRGWEWNYLARMCRERSRPLEGHTGHVSYLTFSGDGTRLASLSPIDKTVRIWDVKRGTLVSVWQHPDVEKPPLYPVLYNVALNATGRLAAVPVLGKEMTQIFVWETDTGRIVSTPVRLTGRSPLGNVAFSPDGKRLTVRDRLYDVETGKVVVNLAKAPLELRQSQGNFPTFSHDGELLANSIASILYVWETRTGKLVFEQSLLEQKPQNRFVQTSGLAFSAEGTSLVLLLRDGIRIWDVKTWKEGTVPAGFPDAAAASCLSLDANRFILSQWGSGLWLCNRGAGFHSRDHLPFKTTMSSMAIDPRGEILASSYEHNVHLRSLDTSPRWLSLPTPKIKQLAFRTDGKVVVSWPGQVRTWDTATREFVDWKQPGFMPLTVRADPPLIAGIAGVIQYTKPPKVKRLGFEVWNYVENKKVTTLPLADFEARAAAFDPSGASLAIVDGAGVIGVWNVQPARLVRTLGKHQGQNPGLAFSPDGKLIACNLSERSIRVWEADSGKLAYSLDPPHDLQVANFSPDSRTLALCGTGKVVLWPLAGGEDIVLQLPPRTTGSTATFSPDGKRLAVTDSAKSATLWCTNTGAQTLTFEGGHRECNVAFGPSGLVVYPGSGSIYVCDGSPP